MILAWGWCNLLFFGGNGIRHHSRALQELAFIVREVLGPVRHSIVDGSRDELVELCLEVSKGLLLIFVLLTKLWFQEISSLHLRWEVRVNTKGQYSK